MGSLVVSRVISRTTILVTHIGGLITLLITTHEPPSKASQSNPPIQRSWASSAAFSAAAAPSTPLGGVRWG